LSRWACGTCALAAPAHRAGTKASECPPAPGTPTSFPGRRKGAQSSRMEKRQLVVRHCRRRE
jgi:hypothetical protein